MSQQRNGNRSTIKSEEFHHLVDDIERALFNFESTSNHAVMRLYRRSENISRVSEHSYFDEDSTFAGNDNEAVFLVYL
jgi:hypothetical protein